MTDAEKYRAKASECLAQADKTSNPLFRDVWLLLAERWLVAAQRADITVTKRGRRR
jgi:hypothetical protein